MRRRRRLGEELREELGLGEEGEGGCKISPVLFKFLLPKWKYNDALGREYVAVFDGLAQGEIKPNSKEVKEGKFVSFSELGRLIESNPDTFTPDALLALAEYIGRRRKRKKNRN